jgi:molybdopterin/thiamine biosynthesis adenylyltransferase/rhodanese-related sulfurtransferase
MNGTGLDEADRERYGRHLVLAEVGEAGQERLQAARVLVLGVGGLGSPAALYLAAGGVGHLTLVDFDHVELSNLQRQVLFATADVGRPKVEAAAERLRALNPEIAIDARALRVDAGNVLELCASHDVVVDGSDNAPTRYLVNDACVALGQPDVWGAVQRFEGQLSIFGPADGPCYRCLFPQPPPPGLVPSCAEGGVLGVLPGVVGALQATEAIKWILGAGRPAVGRMLIYDALSLRLREVTLSRNPECPACADRAGLRKLMAAEAAGRPTMAAEIPMSITVEDLAAWRRDGRAHLLLDVREPHEFTLAAIDGARLVPLRQLPQQLASLDREATIVVQCHHGGRSAQAVQFLRQQGFPGATNLTGGIDAWSARVDPAVPRY